MHKLFTYLTACFPLRSMERQSLDLIREAGFRRINAVILCGLSVLILSVYFVFDIYKQNLGILPILALAAVMPCVCLLWMRRREDVKLPMLCMGFNLLLLAILTLVFCSSPDGGSLLWHLIFPPLVVFCMGLRLGFLIWGAYFVFLLFIMYSPLQAYLNYDYPGALRTRFMIANLLEFAAFWILEFVREQAHKALIANLDRMSRYAYTDPLTDLGNRRDFQNHLNWVQAQAKRTGSSFSLALVDLDHFKRVNDTYGHQVGDLVLKHCAENISSSLRETDRLFRWGGEEFALLMPNTSLPDAVGVAERVRVNLAAAPYLHKGRPIFVSISLGVDSWSGDNDATTLLTNADARLYLAKAGGRNRVHAGMPAPELGLAVS